MSLYLFLSIKTTCLLCKFKLIFTKSIKYKHNLDTYTNIYFLFPNTPDSKSRAQ